MCVHYVGTCYFLILFALLDWNAMTGDKWLPVLALSHLTSCLGGITRLLLLMLQPACHPAILSCLLASSLAAQSTPQLRQVIAVWWGQICQFYSTLKSTIFCKFLVWSVDTSTRKLSFKSVLVKKKNVIRRLIYLLATMWDWNAVWYMSDSCKYICGVYLFSFHVKSVWSDWWLEFILFTHSSTEGIYKIIRPAIGEALRYFLFIITFFLAQFLCDFFETHTASWSLSVATM